MTLADLDEVMAIELQAYPFPWTPRNVEDSLAAGYRALVWVDEAGCVQAYYLAMKGVDEFHLLNITVAPALQGRGLARRMLDDLRGHAQACGRGQIWLEVRQSNQHARDVYRACGFAEVGLRRAYYPAGQGRREDAVLMSLSWPSDGAAEGAP